MNRSYGPGLRVVPCHFTVTTADLTHLLQLNSVKAGKLRTLRTRLVVTAPDSSGVLGSPESIDNEQTRIDAKNKTHFMIAN